MLRCEGISKSFGGTVALDDISLTVNRGEIHGLIGPNGSGKTSLVNLVSGFYQADEGAIYLNDNDITGKAAHVIRRLGLARTFQNIRLYGDLTVLDNVLIGLHLSFLQGKGSPRAWAGALIGSRQSRRREQDARARAMSTLEGVGLAGLAAARTRDLPYGLRKRLELARATIQQPTVLLLDEPTAGLSPAEANDVLHVFEQPAREHGLAVLLIEHRLEWVLEICDRVTVLDAGSTIASGTPAEISRDQEVIRAYIGE